MNESPEPAATSSSSDQVNDEESLQAVNQSSDNSLNNLDVFPDPTESFYRSHQQSVWTMYDANTMSQHDETYFENLIIQFCIYYLPLKKNYSGQCRDYIQLAQHEVIQMNYGNAIARYKDFLSFVDNLAVSKTKSDFSTGRIIELKTLANERLAMCYLLKNNVELALKYAHKAIIQKPVVAQSHMWRAIANRRLGNLETALRSMTMFGTLISVSLHECPYQLEEQRIISLYWKIILVRVQESWKNIKLLHFPSFHLNRLPTKEQEERMSITFLMNYPVYNSLIHADPFSLHLLPVGSGIFAEALLEQKQAYGFKYNQENSRYFANLSEASYFNSHSAEDKEYWNSIDAETAKQLWETSAFINSTSSQMSLKPGKGLYEHLLYCHFLLKEEQFFQVSVEYECILADLALFPVLSDVEWTDDLALVVDANIEMIEIAIEALKEHNAKALEASREIEQIKQWLELSERKFRVQQRQAAEGELRAVPERAPRNYYSPKRKYTSLHKFLEETKSKRHLFPKS